MSSPASLLRLTRSTSLKLLATGLVILALPGFISPGAVAADDPLDPVQAYLAQNPDEREQAIDCLSDAVFYEAGSEPIKGQRAVAQVVLNRVRDENYPDTVCGVVYQGWRKGHGCQFSFVCDGSMRRRRPDDAQAATARRIAIKALHGRTVHGVNNATHYHADYVDPYWAPFMEEMTTVGTHVFYRAPRDMPDTTVRGDFYDGGEVAFRARVRIRGA